MLAHQFIGRAREHLVAVNQDAPNAGVQTRNLEGFLGFLELPNVKTLFASAADHRLASGTKSNAEQRLSVSRVRLLQFPARWVHQSGRLIAAHRSQMRPIRA